MRAVIEEPEADISDNSKVILSTFHRSKGLEWQDVYIAGASDGLMPMRNSAGEVADEAEERCTSYVGLTRAKNHCSLYHADMIDLGYDQLLMTQSPYIEEMGAVPGRSQTDPLPPIIRLKSNGAADMVDLAKQQALSPESVSQVPGQQAAGHLNGLDHFLKPQDRAYAWEKQDIPGW